MEANKMRPPEAPPWSGMIEPFGPSLTELVASAGWTVEGTPEHPWLRAVPAEPRVLPTQGWKLHVSASGGTADAVLARAVPVLVAAGATFKVASTRAHLAILNGGMAGESQVGKFLTVYPADADGAVEIAAALDRALGDLTGPTVPSDRALRQGGTVSYRYGSFHGRLMQAPHGPLVQAIERPDGTLVADTRLRQDAVPTWLDDPFEAAGLVEPPAEPPLLIGDHFLPVATVYRSARRSVYLAVDLRGVRRCVLKHAPVDGDPTGTAARLVHEHDVLKAVEGCPGVVSVVAFVNGPDECILALEDIPGRTLMAEAMASAVDGYHLQPERVLDVGLQLSATVAAIHRRHIVHRDIKPSNVIVEPDGRVRLIDFELAARVDGERPHGYGTRGYVGPEQHRREPAHPADDVYALGGTLYTIATGAEMATR
ncbi:MAG TPA: protein kinase, partial [Acidimicrobiales bacterium]|nr:protein kinase [Acidimicrobiales bacterium]